MESQTTMNPLQSALIAVQLCNVAADHHPVQNIGKLVPGWKIVWSSGDTTDPNYSFVATNTTEDVYVLTIRGSVAADKFFTDWDGFVDWIVEDLDEALAYWPFASAKKMPCVSAGAYVAFTSMLMAKNALGANEPLLDFLLAKAVGGDKQLIITGHSLGGNIANVYASYYLEMLKQKSISTGNVYLYTFAAPASGNSDFVDDLQNKVQIGYHYQNTNDAVPNFPVAQGLVDTSNFYEPNTPDAAAIIVKFKDGQATLQQVYLLLADLFTPFDYQQPKKNYVKFTTDLDLKYKANTIEDWLQQAAIQHQLFNYAGYFGITLPPVNQTTQAAEMAL